MGLRVTIADAVTGAKVTLCDSPDPLPSFNLRINNQRVLQVQSLFRAPAVQIFDRKNKTNTISFEVTRHTDGNGKAFASILDATLFAMDHCNNTPSVGLVTLTLSNGNQSGSRWFSPAGVKSIEMVKQRGVTMVFQYDLIGGALLTKNPNT